MNKSVIYILSLIVILVVTLILVLSALAVKKIVEFGRDYYNVYTPRVSIVSEYDNLKSGDVILFASTVSMGINIMVTGTYFTHAGVVIRYGDDVYVAETQRDIDVMPSHNDPNSDAYDPNDVIVAPILIRLKYYTGIMYVCRLKRKLSEEEDVRLKKLVEYSVHNFKYPGTSDLLMNLFGIKTNTYHCYQYTGRLLDEIGIKCEGGTKQYSALGPIEIGKKICNIYGDTNEYSEPIRLVYDIY